MKYQVTPELLHKYLDGECTPEEAFMLYQWYDAFEKHNDPLEDMSPVEQEALKMLMLRNFKNKLLSEDVVEEPVKRSVSVKLMYAMAGIAATVLLVWAGLNLMQKPADTINGVFTTATEQMEVSNLTNSIYKQVLSDGSIVWLSPKSKLRYPKKFMGAYRQVKMTGEAFFEVTKDHAHPFIIYSGGIITRVWGTSFRIKSVQNVNTEVSVVTGKVSVKIPEHDESEVMLLPTQKVTYQQLSKSLNRDIETTHSAMRIWQKATISFDNVPLSNVLNTLDKQYGMHIHTDDKELGSYLFKADFTGQSLPAILDMLENSLNVSYTMDDTDIILYRNKPITN
ncbi:FecR family protein [Mucilaginibacter sp. AW1-3]